MSKTWVFDGDVYVGNYKPSKSGKTAHAKLESAANCYGQYNIGGSIKKDGTIEFRSETINNRSIGKCDAKGSGVDVIATDKLKSGDYYNQVGHHKSGVWKHATTGKIKNKK